MKYSIIQFRVSDSFVLTTMACSNSYHDSEQSAAEWFIAEYNKKPISCSMAMERCSDGRRYSYKDCRAITA